MDEDSSTKFIGSLTKFLQSLCNGYVEFQKGVELVGHIYLSIDTGEKVDYILHEKVNKNDENSVTFVSNSFHAQPQNKDKTKETPSKSDAKGSNERLHDDDDDDDIMIVDHSQGVIGSTNSGSVLPRGMKRMASPGSDHRHGQRARTSAGSSSTQNQNASGHSFTSINRQHSGRPSATVTSQGASQSENLNISEVKLEQISRDELLTLASQVGEGTAGPSHSSSSGSRSHSQPQHSGMASGSGRGDAALWVKQEVTDDGGGGNDSGWSQERDDSNSNSGSNLYPVMLHQNPAAFPSSSIPGFSGPGGSGNQSAGNPFPMPGTSQDLSGLDPSVSAPGQFDRDVFDPRSIAQSRHPALRGNYAGSVDSSSLRAPAHPWGYSAYFGMDSSNNPHSYPSPPADLNSLSPKKRKVVVTQMWREKLKQNPEAYRLYRQKQQQYVRKYRAKKRLLRYCSSEDRMQQQQQQQQQQSDIDRMQQQR